MPHCMAAVMMEDVAVFFRQAAAVGGARKARPPPNARARARRARAQSFHLMFEFRGAVARFWSAAITIVVSAAELAAAAYNEDKLCDVHGECMTCGTRLVGRCVRRENVER